MTIIDIVALALALSIDAFAVSLAVTAAGRLDGPRAVFRLSFHFGLFQFLMPVIGWMAGSTLQAWVAPVDHWIAAGLLTLIGGRMIRAAGAPGGESGSGDPSRGMTLLALSTATSLDALAVGLSLGMLRVGIWVPSVCIGLVAGVVSLVGIRLGKRARRGHGRAAEIAGGAILLLLALQILVTHLSGD